MSKRSDSGLDGILLIDKPAGWTSHDVVARVRKVTGQRRIGHTGTLDPMATGLLVLCLGAATRLVEYMMGHGKRYTGMVKLGTVTTTDDAEGEPLERRPVPPLDDAELERAVEPLRGRILQRPPAFSALKVGGQRAYRLARRGEGPELAPREVVIHRFEALRRNGEAVEIDVTCSSGTYIRSLARDLGEALGCGGHLAALRREASGPFRIDDAMTLEAVEAAVMDGGIESLLLPADEALLGFDAALLGAAGASAFARGQSWRTASWRNLGSEAIRVYSSSGAFVGVGILSNSGEIRPRKVILRAKS